MYEDMVRSLGTIFDNRKLYGAAHKVTIQSLEQSFEMLTSALAAENELLLTVTPDEFNINHKAVETKNSLIAQFADMLRAHELSTLTISKDMSADEFLQFIDLVSQDPKNITAAGGLTEQLQAEAFSHIASRKVVYVEVSDDDIVVKKTELGGGSSRADIEETVMEYLGVPTEEKPQPANESVACGMLELMSAPMELGEIIVQSAGVSLNIDIPGSSPLPEDVISTLIERIVQCLERAFEVLKNDPSARSQKGKKELTKSLKTLEKDLESVITQAVTPIEEGDLNPIYSAIDAMTDELEIDALAAEYLRKRRLIESSEKRLLKYMERQQDDIDGSELKNKLIDGGLPEHSWEMLVAASGRADVPAEKPLSLENPEFKQLQDKLVKLTKVFCNMDSDHDTTPEQLQEIIHQVEEQLEKLIERTERRIKHILDSIIADENSSEARETESSKKLTRRQLLELIAEIVQELYQPLSVIQCVVQTMLTKKINLDAPEQREFMELANRSAQRMTSLIGELYTVVGTPSSLTPSPVVIHS